MKLTKSSIKKASLVALLENLRSYAYLSDHEQNVLKGIGRGYIDLILRLNYISGTFEDMPMHCFDTNTIYRLKPGTTLKQLKEACFPTPEKQEPRFSEYDIYEKQGNWYFDVCGEPFKVLEQMNNRTDFAGLKYGEQWYMSRQYKDGNGFCCSSATVAEGVAIDIPTMIRFVNPEFKENE